MVGHNKDLYTIAKNIYRQFTRSIQTIENKLALEIWTILLNIAK